MDLPTANSTHKMTTFCKYGVIENFTESGVREGGCQPKKNHTLACNATDGIRE